MTTLHSPSIIDASGRLELMGAGYSDISDATGSMPIRTRAYDVDVPRMGSMLASCQHEDVIMVYREEPLGTLTVQKLPGSLASLYWGIKNETVLDIMIPLQGFWILLSWDQPESMLLQRSVKKNN